MKPAVKKSVTFSATTSPYSHQKWSAPDTTSYCLGSAISFISSTSTLISSPKQANLISFWISTIVFSLNPFPLTTSMTMWSFAFWIVLYYVDFQGEMNWIVIRRGGGIVFYFLCVSIFLKYFITFFDILKLYQSSPVLIW